MALLDGCREHDLQLVLRRAKATRAGVGGRARMLCSGSVSRSLSGRCDVSKSFFQTVPGELVGPLPVLLASLTCLSVFCIVAGALFVAAARMVNSECAVDARAAVSAAYLLEAAGSALGGIVASMMLLRSLDPFQIAVCRARPEPVDGNHSCVADESQANWSSLRQRRCCWHIFFSFVVAPWLE